MRRLAASLHDRFPTSRRGFSLIEVACALILAALVLALGLPRFHGYQHRVHRAAVVQALRSVAAREDAYWRAVGSYTADSAALMAPQASGITVRVVSADSLGWSALAMHQRDTVVCAIAYGAARIIPPATRHNVIGCRS